MHKLSFPVFVTALLVANAVFPHPAWAQGNYLFPSDNKNPSSPDLGLVPKGPPAEKTPAPPKPEPVKPPAATSLPYTPAPAPKPAPSSAPPVVPPTATQLPRPLAAPTRTNKVKIGTATPYRWTNQDYEKVKIQLGVPRDKVESVCQPGLSVLVLTDPSGLEAFTSDFKSSRDITYAGRINRLTVLVRATCSAAFLPPEKIHVMHYDNKYEVNLSIGNCTIPAANQPEQILISFNEQGAAECQYKN